VISVRELTKLYGTFPAVRGLSLDVGVGEVLGLAGRSLEDVFLALTGDDATPIHPAP